MVFSCFIGCLAAICCNQEEASVGLLKETTRKILARAYSSVETPPPYMFGKAEPRIERDSKTISINYPGGSVSFSKDGKPGYFECFVKPERSLELSLSIGQKRDRATAFVREFMPEKAFQIDSDGEFASAGFTIRILEQGTPHFNGFWFLVNGTTGVITHGSFPPRLPVIDRVLEPRKFQSKDNAVAAAIQTAFVHTPELETFEILGARMFWIVPKVEYKGQAPPHVLKAEANQKAIQAYLVETTGRRLVDKDPLEQKVGAIWVDAETGRPFAGRFVYIDSFGAKAKSLKVKLVSVPKLLYMKRSWVTVRSSKPTGEESSDPKGNAVLAMEGSAIVKARMDINKRLLWLPTAANKWRSLLVGF